MGPRRTTLRQNSLGRLRAYVLKDMAACLHNSEGARYLNFQAANEGRRYIQNDPQKASQPNVL
jgi:hypothetical protein